MKLTILTAALTALAASTASAADFTVYKNPECGCCEEWAEYLREHGHVVTVRPTHRLGEMGRTAGIPDAFQGCHLAEVEGYVVSGHVPVSAIDRLLAERPALKGITLPGMPAGSPGMGGPKTEPFRIIAIGDGEPRIYAVE